MSIRTKLYASLMAQVILVAVAGVVLIGASRAIGQANDKNARTSQLSTGISELRFLTMENILNHDSQSLDQWQSKYRGVSAMFNPYPTDTPAERQILADMAAEHSTAASLFDRLNASYNQPSPDPTAQGTFRERLTGQLLVRQQTQITDAGKLAALSRDEITSAHTRFSGEVLGVVILMLVITGLNAGVITRGITSSLRSLQAGVAALTAGKLDYRVHTRHHDEFGQLAVGFNAMADGLQRVDKTKSEFILMASHQLRTPATAVKDLLSLVLGGYKGQVPQPQGGIIEQAFRENEHQLKLIDDLLNAAQMDAGKIRLEESEVNLVELINAVLNEQREAIRAKRQSVQLSTPEVVRLTADPIKLQMVFDNLVSNANKYSPEGGAIMVTVTPSNHHVTVAVRDNGIGIAQNEQANLFKRFSRASNAAKTHSSGSGLGLYLAKNIVELHNGHIEVVSELGQGSTFTVTLPTRHKEIDHG